MAKLRSLLALLLVAVLGAPFVLVARAGGGLVAPLSEAVVVLLLRVSTALAVAPTEGPADLPALEEAEDESALAVQGARKSPARQRGASKAAPAALFVARDTVLRLSQSAARPRGSFVNSTAAHPSGLVLSGVAGLGIGVQDGDILVEALGISPRAPGEIVGAIIAARAKRLPALSGTLWRHGRTFRITVEQPY